MPPKVALPPKPVPKIRAVKVILPETKKPSDIKGLEAVSYVILLNDGTTLEAKGEHANVIYTYLSACERMCAERQLINYLGPSLARMAADGTFMAQGTD